MSDLKNTTAYGPVIFSLLYSPPAYFQTGVKGNVPYIQSPGDQEAPNVSIIPRTLCPTRSGIRFGEEFQIDYSPSAFSVITEARLVFVLNPLAASGGGINPRYSDDARTWIDQYDLTYGGISVRQINEFGMIERSFNEIDDNWRDFLIAVNEQPFLLTDAERITRATAQQTLSITLPMLHHDRFAKQSDKNHNFAFHAWATPRPLSWKFRLKNFNAILQQELVDAAPTSTVGDPTNFINDVYLQLQTAYIGQGIITAFKTLLTSPIMYHLPSVRTERFTVPNGSAGEISFQLRNNNFPTYLLRLFWRRTQNVNPSYLRNKYLAYERFPTGTTLELLNGSDSLTGEWDHQRLLDNMSNRLYDSFPYVTNIYQFYWGDAPGDHDGIPVSLAWNAMKNPIIRIRLGAAVTEDWYLDVFYFTTAGIEFKMEGTAVTLTRFGAS